MIATADLGLTLSGELADELLKRAAYVSDGIRNARMTDDGRRVLFDVLEGYEDRAAAAAAAIADIAAGLSRDHRALTARTIGRWDGPPPTGSEDPHPALVSGGDLIPLGPGRYAFGPRLVRLIAALDARIVAIGETLGASQFAFPSLIGADVLDRCQYFRNFPAAISFVSHLREDYKGIRSFARTARWDGARLAFDSRSLSDVDCVLAPSVCFHWYACLGGGSWAPTTITAAGRCFRYESTNLHGLERLWDFTMREVVFAGPPDYVLRQRGAAVDLATRLLEQLGLSYECTTAADPFFVDVFAAQAAYQQAFELKYELLAPLPYSGRRLAVGSINYHQDFFGRSFSIRSGFDLAHTGCLGFGLERLALAFVVQHGLDERVWEARLSA